MPQPIIDYYAHEALSNSGIKELLVTPEHYQTWRNTPKEESSAMRVGSRLHEVFLEGVKVESFPVFTETKTFDSKAGRLFLEANPKAVTLEEFQKIEAMADRLKKNDKAQEFLSVCQTEIEIYAESTTSYGPIRKKAKLDGVSSTFIFDLKTTSERASDFIWAKRKYKYDIQAAWYLHMASNYLFGDFRELAFFFIVIETNPPYGIKVWPVKKETIAEGMQKCVRAVEIYGQCINSGIWPGYNNDDLDNLEEL